MPRGPQPWACILFVTLLLVPPAAAEDARVTSSAYRFDLRGVAPGSQHSGTFTLTNPGTEAVLVRLAFEGDGPHYVRLARDEVRLEVGESLGVPFRYHVPADAPPGDHADVLRLLPHPADGEGGATNGVIVAGKAILFTSRTLAVGPTAIEAPAMLLPEDPLSGRILVINTLETDAESAVRLRLLADGEEVGRWESPVETVLAGGTVAFPYVWEDPLAPGTLTLEARAVDAAGVEGSLLRQDVVVGRRALAYTILETRDTGEGALLVRLRVENTGSVPVTAEPRVTLWQPDGTRTSHDLTAFALAPGDVREVQATLAAPPGDYTLDAHQRPSADEPVESESVRTSATIAAPRLSWSAPAWTWRAAGGALIVALAATGGSVALRRARAAPPVMVFVDVPGLRGARLSREDLLRATGGRQVKGLRAYHVARDADGAGRAHHALAAAGFAPTVRVGPDAQAHLALALDAWEASQQGVTVILASHDPGLAPLARHVRNLGGRVELLGLQGQLPRALVESAHAVHGLTPRAAA